MASEEHLAILRQGVDVWNVWRKQEPEVVPDLRQADLIRADLSGANLSGATLYEANLRAANLIGADLSAANLMKAMLYKAYLRAAHLSDANLYGAALYGADLRGANLSGATLYANFRHADLRETILCGADLRGADLTATFLSGADLTGANLRRADLSVAELSKANLSEADLRGANLRGAVLRGAVLIEADLRGADLEFTSFVLANLTNANLTGSRIFGTSAWQMTLSQGTEQRDLIVTPKDEPKITVDDIEVAQFVYLLIHNEKIQKAIDTIGKKAVLILGRFLEERKKVLDALRDELRKHDYLPILFDFDKPASKDLTGTVLTLAHIARFIIADLTDPSCIPYEVSKVADAFVPIQPILLSSKSEFAMFVDMQRRHHWVLATRRYDSQEQLIANLGEWVIGPAEDKVRDLQGAQPE